MSTVSKFIWTEKAVDTTVGSDYANSLVFSKLGWLATHDTKFWLPLVAKDTETTKISSTTAVFTKEGEWRTLPSNAFADTTYTASTNATSNSSVVTSFELKGTEFVANTSDVATVALANLGTYTLTGGDADTIAATDSLGTALAKLQAKIDSTTATADAGMSFQGVTSSTTSYVTSTGATYVVGADGSTPSGVTAAVGDTIVYDGTAWQVIPSGNDARYASVTDGTNTASATTAGSSLTFAAGAKTVVSVSGSSDATITYSHATASAISSTTGSATTMTFGGDAVNVLTSVATDSYGHLTGYTLTPVALPSLTAATAGTAATWGGTQTVGSITIDGTATEFKFTLPSNPNSVTSIAASATATGDNGGATIATTEDNGVTASSSVVKIIGSGTVSVDYSDGKIVISAADDSRVSALGVAAATSGDDATFTVTNSDSTTVAATMLLDESFKYGDSGLDIVWGELA